MWIVSMAIGEYSVQCERSEYRLVGIVTSRTHGIYVIFTTRSFSYVSGDILLGQYGDTCDINLDECEADLVCDSR